MKYYIILLFAIIILISFIGSPEDIELEDYSLEIYVCPSESCYNAFINTITYAKIAKCAFYDLDLEIIKNLTKKETKFDLVLEKNNVKDILSYINNNPNIKYVLDSNPSYMHNKFCILDDEIVLTGSTNPTMNGFFKNNNTIIIINSSIVAQIYTAKFNKLKDPSIQNKKIENKLSGLEIYFCPEDLCSDKLIKEIKNAKNSIYFATFSFTDKSIATELILAKQRGVKITGVIENRMATNSVYSYLLTQNISVKKDINPHTMHHKLFLIDDTTLIVGSYNPTNNGNKNNDENFIIYHSTSNLSKIVW